jgi:hypothetical protein
VEEKPTARRSRPLLLGARDAVIDELGDGPAASGGEGPEGEELVLGGLAGRGDAAIEATQRPAATAITNGLQPTWDLAG